MTQFLTTPILPPKTFKPLEQDAFQKLKHASFLKGLLKPFKGKGELEECANQCHELRDGLMGLAQQKIIHQTQTFPFALLPAQLIMQSTSAGTSFLRWRNLDRSVMGVALWKAMVQSPLTPVHLIPDLYAIEQQRIVLNMQISLMHTFMRQSEDCASKMGSAHAIYAQRIHQGFI